MTHPNVSNITIDTFEFCFKCKVHLCNSVFQLLFFFSFVSLVRVWMEQLFSRWKRKMFVTHGKVFVISRRVIWSSPSSCCKWDRLIKGGNVIYFQQFQNVRNIRFLFFSAVIFIKTISVKCRNFKQNFVKFPLSCISNTVANNGFC